MHRRETKFDTYESRVAARFETTYRQHYRLLLTVAHQRLGVWDDAEDAVSAVFRVAWQYCLDGHELTLPWLYQTLRNVIGTEYRRRARAGTLTSLDEISDHCDVLLDPDNASLTVRIAIQQLPEPDRELLYMTYWEDLSGSEISAILGTTPLAVRLRLVRARKRLRTLLDEGNSSEPVETVATTWQGA